MVHSMSHQAGNTNLNVGQGQSTLHNDRQNGQRDCAGVSTFADPVFVDEGCLRTCRNELDAINVCIYQSRMSSETLCSTLGIDKGHWSRIRSGRAHFPTAKRLDLMRLAGNWAPIQYELQASGVGQLLFEMWSAKRDEEDRKKEEQRRRGEGRQMQTAWMNFGAGQAA